MSIAFGGIPFVVRTVQPVLEELGPGYEEMAQTLGAGQWQTFRRVILPEVARRRRCWRNCTVVYPQLGQFGTVIFIASNIDRNHALAAG
ncbi:MAG: Sulfate transport system permease protein CysW [Sodalis sp.]|nr:MAG: Sulfate transport system permease protein CysW [Sodalis sp.]